MTTQPSPTIAYTRTALCLFALLFILFIPFPFYIFPFQQGISDALFNNCIAFIAENILGFKHINPELSSDSLFMYILAGLLFCISAAVALFFSFYKARDHVKQAFFTGSRKLFCYYLALQLLKYGFDKVFKCQFYMPEPNILYTPLGQLDKDILFWSSMGTSYTYNLFMGGAEVTAALLILFRKTRVGGLLMAAAIMINVAAINFSFDISVKVYSLFLLFLSVLLLAPQLGRMYRFLFLQQVSSLAPEPLLFPALQNKVIRTGLKALIICILFTEALYPYVAGRNFNDDTAPRPFLHGAYEVIEAVQPGDSLVRIASPIKRFFIHRDGFLIFQDNQDRMQDFKLEISRHSGQFVLTDYSLNRELRHFTWNEKDSLLELYHSDEQGEYLLKAKALDWKNLPALQNNFHWTVEGVN